MAMRCPGSHAGLVDRAHAAAANLAQYLVFADFFADQGKRGCLRRLRRLGNRRGRLAGCHYF